MSESVLAFQTIGLDEEEVLDLTEEIEPADQADTLSVIAQSAAEELSQAGIWDIPKFDEGVRRSLLDIDFERQMRFYQESGIFDSSSLDPDFLKSFVNPLQEFVHDFFDNFSFHNTRPFVFILPQRLVNTVRKLDQLAPDRSKTVLTRKFMDMRDAIGAETNLRPYLLVNVGVCHYDKPVKLSKAKRRLRGSLRRDASKPLTFDEAVVLKACFPEMFRGNEAVSFASFIEYKTWADTTAWKYPVLEGRGAAVSFHAKNSRHGNLDVPFCSSRIYPFVP